MSKVRTFDTGATRDGDGDKLDYEGFLSPDVLLRFAQYMHQHRVQSDGSLRDSDNWQRGIPVEQYLKSMLRHVMDVWLFMRGTLNVPDIEESLSAVLFNTQGMLLEILKQRQPQVGSFYVNRYSVFSNAANGSDT